MKKRVFVYVSIFFAALCLAFTACNGMTAGKGTGTVQVVIGGGAARSVDPASGLPVFDETNTRITVTKEDGSKVVDGEQKTEVTLQLPVGTKITVEVKVTTAAGEWRGSKEHTVTAGNNPVTVTLSKTPKSMKNILVDDVEQGAFGDATVTLKLANGKTLSDHVQINGNYIIPVTARDGNGRIYALYDKSGRHFNRFDTEGKIDPGFESAIMGVLPSAIGITAMTVDPKTNRIFVVDGVKHVHVVTETGHNTFVRSGSDFDLTTLSDIGTSGSIIAVAAYDNAFFVAVEASGDNKVVYCKATVSGTSFSLTAEKLIPLKKLRTGSAMSVPTQCTGLFADASGVYCLLLEKALENGTLYAVGALAYYSFDTNAVSYLGEHSEAGTTDVCLPFESASFANPVGFIGSDEENIYIADDGINIENLNENWRINGNKNRIAAFKRKTKEITFSDSDATWYAEKPVYKFPETPVLLWEKDTNVPPTYHGVRYWVSTDGTSSAPTEATKIFQTTVSTNEITDIFCYDQEGNLYILWKESTVYCVTRFELKNGTYDFTQGQQLNLGIAKKVVAIAADVSDGQNFLYCAVKETPTTYKIKQWQWDSTFTGAPSTAYNITLPSDKDVTALAANKDGVFVGVRAINVSPAGYTLSVQKYAKQDGADKGTITVGEFQLTPTEPSGPSYPPYTKIDNTVNDLRIVNGVLYAVTSKLEKRMVYRTVDYGTDEFKSSGLLYKIAEAASFSGNAMVLHTKYPVLPQGTSRQGVGYGFYRFIAVKPKKLVIASGGACARGGNALAPFGTQPDRASDNKVMIYDLDGNLQEPEEKNAGGTFSQKLSVDGSGFNWE